jgi:4-hydroxy-L-threonine phosphate dehydrogenase PdxA
LIENIKIGISVGDLNGIGLETIVKAFAVNSDTYDYKKTIEVTTEELENASAPMPLDKATNLQLVE